MLILEGERILLRDHRPDDLPAFHAWRSDPAVTRFLHLRNPSRADSSVALAEAICENGRASRTRYFFAVVLRETGAVIGEAGFTVERQGADMGYFLLPAYWGRGYAGEAARLMLSYCFGVLGLQRVTAGCDAENAASEGVMQKCGMRLVARLEHHSLLDGEWRGRLEYAITAEEWACMHNASA